MRTFCRLKSDLPFSLATAEQLMAIARHPVISNSDHGQILPASWRTLYQLTRLSEEVLEAKIADGTCLTVSRWSLNPREVAPRITGIASMRSNAGCVD